MNTKTPNPAWQRTAARQVACSVLWSMTKLDAEGKPKTGCGPKQFAK